MFAMRIAPFDPFFDPLRIGETAPLRHRGPKKIAFTASSIPFWRGRRVGPAGGELDVPATTFPVRDRTP